MDDTKKEYPVCSHCGSTNVVKDAWAEWDHETQDWTLRVAFDDEHCEDCEGETSLDWKDGDPPPEEEDGCSGQDRESYSDSHDRQNYTVGDD